METEKNLETPRFKKLAGQTAENLVRICQEHAFRLFRDRNFRVAVKFSKLPQLEKDRIFNELLLASITLVMFVLEAPDINAPEELKTFFEEIKEAMPEKLTATFAGLGVEEKYLRDWRKLIKMRYEEYSEDRLGMRSAAMELEEKEAPLTVERLRDIQLLLPAQAVGIGTLCHIRRGQLEENDPLVKIILRWLGDLFLPIRLMTEGKRYSPWHRKWLHVKRWLSRLFTP